MFKNIFGKDESTSTTGFFKVDNGKLIGINVMPGNGSINNVIESLGYPTSHIHTVYVFNSDKIQSLGFKALSKDLVFVLAKSKNTKLRYSDLQKDIQQINWASEYSSLNVEEILQNGIEMENFDFNFLKSVVDLEEDSESIYRSKQLGLYLKFENNILTSFTSSSWDNSATKWLAEINPVMVQKMIKEAKQHHQNDMDSMEEVNIQAKSLLAIPDAVTNEFIPLHTKDNGNVSFYNLLMTHYKISECNIEEFLFMNKGRFIKIDDHTIELGNYIYNFNALGQLTSVEES